MICRRGKVVKADIGAIRITDNETRFEIANAVVERFTIASLVADGRLSAYDDVDRQRLGVQGLKCEGNSFGRLENDLIRAGTNPNLNSLCVFTGAESSYIQYALD